MSYYGANSYTPSFLSRITECSIVVITWLVLLSTFKVRLLLALWQTSLTLLLNLIFRSFSLEVERDGVWIQLKSTRF